MNKLETAVGAIDRYNRQDPVLFQWNGESWPQEYFFSLRVCEWIERLSPDAGEELLLAARAHHIGRWEIPRDQYPDGKAGYLNWRKRLAELHAEKAGAILEEAGYLPAQRERVKELILKKQLKSDPEVQLLENALCLVFLQYQYEDFRQKHPKEKVVHILRKSLRKMDGQGREEALKLDYSEQGLVCIREAI
ncbi:uncharacterized protein DUF4202 [Anseongella ginsenosidimutans]|uniref:Uncharacterized protein DUF4202 n=1 Tax=Anseongella ginsenosidimutans TaxID=496056 RepID=A0A4R3KT17_9SPHI|nr:DUF4202 domain-containing protein [Anseongella ginsenosidimutans]QEC53394.1 DUF4202 domain-containing protein [Anseongella ginsenosidimutans]TCS88284.1 uncharacterized protein DUF4202 [Anseongella ginsenosidimutans]